MVYNFLFHRVNPVRNQMWDPMDVALFERCIKYIQKKYTVVLLEELMASNSYDPKKNYATICFDDGYKDNIEYAAPILAKYNCKASFYVVTDCIDNNVVTWTHILEHTFEHTNIPAVNFKFSFLPEALQAGTLTTQQERIAYVKKLKPFAKTITHEQREEILAQLHTTFTDIELPKIMMSWDDVRQLKREGHYIGSHTLTHCMLGTMSNEMEITKELVNSGERIKAELGYFPATISYPVGSYNATTMELSKAAGYTIGLAVGQQSYDPLKDGIFEIPRIELYNEPWWKTRMRITHLLEKIKKIIRYK